MKRFALYSLAFSLTLIALSAPAQEVAYGEAFVAGETWHLIQQTNTVGKLIARDAGGGVHLVWTSIPDGEETRHVLYAYSGDDGDVAAQFAENISTVDNEQRAGYCSMDLIDRDGEPAAAVFYHGGMRAIMSFDFARGWGAFSPFRIALPGSLNPISVKGCATDGRTIHILAGTHFMDGSAGFPIVLYRGTSRNGDDWRAGEPAVIDTLAYLSHLIVASHTSDKVAVIRHHNLVGTPAPAEWEGRTEYSMNADLWVVESEDGENWSWNDPVSVTKTIPPDPELEGVAAFGDTLRPYSDIDAIYLNDVLHIVFSAHGFKPDPSGEMRPPVESITENESFIWHWDSETDTLTLVADGWYESESDQRPWDGNVSRPSLGADEEGNLYCAFRKVSPDDAGIDGNFYGEVYLARSSDDGASWSEAVNLTGTHPVNRQGELEYVNERFPSLAELVDSSLHLTYLLQTEPGNESEGIYQIVYQRVPIADLPEAQELPMPRDGFTYHNLARMGGVGDDSPVNPGSFGVRELYPNPFNGATTLSFSLDRPAEIMLHLLDLQGRRIAEIAAGDFSEGEHRIVWEADGVPAGVYLVRLEANGRISTVKATLVR